MKFQVRATVQVSKSNTSTKAVTEPELWKPRASSIINRVWSNVYHHMGWGAIW